MSGILAGIGLWALFIASVVARLYLVKRATAWADELCCSLADAAIARGDNWRRYYGAFSPCAIEAAYAWRSVFNPFRWRYADFYPELERLRRAAA